MAAWITLPSVFVQFCMTAAAAGDEGVPMSWPIPGEWEPGRGRCDRDLAAVESGAFSHPFLELGDLGRCQVLLGRHVVVVIEIKREGIDEIALFGLAGLDDAARADVLGEALHIVEDEAALFLFGFLRVALVALGLQDRNNVTLEVGTQGHDGGQQGGQGQEKDSLHNGTRCQSGRD